MEKGHSLSTTPVPEERQARDGCAEPSWVALYRGGMKALSEEACS
jgi:hypothetical protein